MIFSLEVSKSSTRALNAISLPSRRSEGYLKWMKRMRSLAVNLHVRNCVLRVEISMMVAL
jgi:hypothetical protein